MMQGINNQYAFPVYNVNMAKQGSDELPVSFPELVTFSGTVRGGSGWNDPPVCHYDPSAIGVTGQAVAQREHPFHRRRGGRSAAAAVPSFNGSGSQNQPDAMKPGIQLYPPALGTDPSVYVAPIIIPTMSNMGGLCGGPTAMNPVTSATVAVVTTGCSGDLDVPQFEDDEQMFHYVVTRLQRALKDSQITCDSKASEEMMKKVNIFSDMWKNGKISYPVKSSMAHLATAIHKRRCDLADQLQASLMMDHVSEVNKWLVGIKRLIQEVRLTDAPMSPSNPTLNASTGDSCSKRDSVSEAYPSTFCSESSTPLSLLTEPFRTLETGAAASSEIDDANLIGELQRCEVDKNVSEAHSSRLSCSTTESVTLMLGSAAASLMNDTTAEIVPVVLIPPVSVRSVITDMPSSNAGYEDLAASESALDDRHVSDSRSDQ